MVGLFPIQFYVTDLYNLYLLPGHNIDAQTEMQPMEQILAQRSHLLGRYIKVLVLAGVVAEECRRAILLIPIRVASVLETLKLDVVGKSPSIPPLHGAKLEVQVSVTIHEYKMHIEVHIITLTSGNHRVLVNMNPEAWRILGYRIHKEDSTVVEELNQAVVPIVGHFGTTLWKI